MAGAEGVVAETWAGETGEAGGEERDGREAYVKGDTHLR